MGLDQQHLGVRRREVHASLPLQRIAHQSHLHGNHTVGPCPQADSVPTHIVVCRR